MTYLKKQSDNVKKLNDVLEPINLAIKNLDEHGISLEELDVDTESIKDELDTICSALRLALVSILYPIHNPEGE